MIGIQGVKFSENIDKNYDKTPKSPYIIVEIVGDKDLILDDCIKKRYKQGVVYIMQMVKHSHPYISNPLRDL